MKVTFKRYNGIGGESHELLIALSETGAKASELIPKNGLFKKYKIKSAKRKLIKRLNTFTNIKHEQH